MKRKIREIARKEYMPVITAFVLLILFKLIFILPIATGPISFGDEALYKKFSLQWVILGKQLDTHYPPIYPLLLTGSFLFHSHWYMAMKVLNIVYSSFVPVFLYLISRLYLDQKKSIYCMLIGCVLPFHFILPTMILSENVFMPLLLLECYLVLRQYPKHPIAGDVLIGFFLAVLCLSRYISIVTIPVFALVWFMKEFDLKKIGRILARGILILGVMGITYAPWILLNIKEVPFKEIIGFGITSHTNPEQLIGKRLLLSAGFYLCYFILLALPVLPSLMMSLGQINWKKPFARYHQLWVLIVGLAGAFFVAVTRHSWRASYNWPDFTRIMGRYLMCFPILFVLLAFVTIEKQKENAMRQPSKLLVGILCVLSICLGAGAYWVDICGHFYKGSAEQFLNFKGAMEGYKFVMLGVPYLIFACLLMMVIHGIALTKFAKYQCVAVMVAMLIFESIGMNQYVGHMNRFREEKASQAITQMNQLLAGQFAPITETLTEDETLIPLYFDKSLGDVNIKWEERCLKFFCNQYHVKIVKNLDEVKAGQQYYVVTKQTENYSSEQVLNEIGTFERKGAKNTLMLVTK